MRLRLAYDRNLRAWACCGPHTFPPYEEERCCMISSPFMDWIQEITFAGVPLWSLLVAATVAVVIFLAIMTLLHLLTGRARSWATQTQSVVALAVVAVLEGTSRALVLVLAVLVGLGMLQLTPRW